MRFHLSINFIFSQTCISHHGCEKYSNLWCSDKWKTDLQVKKLKEDISATQEKLCHRSLSSPSRQRQITYSPYQGRGLRKGISKSIALSQLFKNINRKMHFLLKGPFQQKPCWLQLLSFCRYLWLSMFSIYFTCLNWIAAPIPLYFF